MTKGTVLKLSCLGQQSFFVNFGDENFLIDPMLNRSFGTSPGLQFEIYPPRQIRKDLLPELTAIVLTNEHLDHFHVPTLASLPQRPPIVCGTLMPNSVTELLQRSGYIVHRLAAGEPYRTENIEVRLYRGGAESMLCEQRVYNVHLGPHDAAGIVFQSDAVVASRLMDAIERGELGCPRCLVATNNSQLALPGSATPWANSLPRHGLRIVRELVRVGEQLGVQDVLLHASGYINPRLQQGPYLWADHKWVSQQVAALTTTCRVHGLDPWEVLVLGNGGSDYGPELPWVQPDLARREELWEQHSEAWSRCETQSVPVRPLLAIDEDNQIQNKANDIAIEFCRMARVLRTSTLLASGESYGTKTAQQTGNALVVRLRNADLGECQQWVYSRDSGSFSQVEHTNLVTSAEVPFGLEVYENDFHGLVCGRLQTWELVTCGLIDYWSLGSRTDGFIAFLFSYFGEQMRPDLAKKTFSQVLSYDLPECEAP